ncbi:hypothetical protein [Poriferisphaera sp. WC338]
MDIVIFIFGVFCVVLAIIVAISVGNVEYKGCYRDKVKEPPQAEER